MSQSYRKSLTVLIFLGCLLFAQFPLPGPASGNPILKKHIIAYNLRAIEKSLAKGTYRGEEGVLRVRPEVAGSLGMKAFVDSDYLDSRHLFREAYKSLHRAKTAMKSRKEESYPGYFAQQIAENFLIFKKNSETAKMKLRNYHSNINRDEDDRFNKTIGAGLIDKMLEEGFRKTGNRLRDGLGYFYNRCQGQDGKGYPLTSKNVRFVNYVFNNFISQATPDEVEEFDIDVDKGFKRTQLDYDWKDIAGPEILKYTSLLEEILRRSENRIYDVDPLLFVALMRKESDFKPLSVSHVGAAGLTQIMPKTALDMGMKNIHLPEYFNDAVSLMKQEREKRKQAMAALFQISEKNRIESAKRARKLMQASLDLGRKRVRLFERYKKELLGNPDDERLQPSKAIEYGLRYFAGLMKKQKGDISLALASYNAGPHRIIEYEGIPPYVETVGFRNRVLECYRGYLRKAGAGREGPEEGE